VQFRQENPIEWSEIDGPYTRSNGGVKTAGLPKAFTDPLRRRDARQFVLALGEWSAVMQHLHVLLVPVTAVRQCAECNGCVTAWLLLR
jgi:hydrogenase/urease accessory protein HupE